MENDSLLALIQATSKEFIRYLESLNDRFSALGSSLHYYALLELDHYKVMNMTQLAHVLNVEKHTTSRLVAKLEAQGLCKIQPNKDNRRFKCISLTPEGLSLIKKINTESQLQMQRVICSMDKQEKETFARGVSMYTRVLQNARLQEKFKVRKLFKKDAHYLLDLPERISREFGFPAHHPAIRVIKHEAAMMQKASTIERGGYFAIMRNTEIVGGIGYCPLQDDNPDTCLLGGLYVVPELRGRGLGKKLMATALRAAKKNGFTHCYIESFECAQNPDAFYENLGFKRLEEPLVTTRNTLANRWYIQEL